MTKTISAIPAFSLVDESGSATQGSGLLIAHSAAGVSYHFRHGDDTTYFDLIDNINFGWTFATDL